MKLLVSTAIVGVLFLVMVIVIRTPDMKGILSRAQDMVAAVIQQGMDLIVTRSADEEGVVAVYLTNGNLYFGKMSRATGKEPILTDVYFLRATAGTVKDNTGTLEEGKTATVEPSGTAESDYELVKLTSQFQAPTDQLILSQDHILFWEPLALDSKVVRAIEKEKGR